MKLLKNVPREVLAIIEFSHSEKRKSFYVFAPEGIAKESLEIFSNFFEEFFIFEELPASVQKEIISNFKTIYVRSKDEFTSYLLFIKKRLSFSARL